MPAPIVRDYFISRAGADKAPAKAIAAIVREAGFTTWLQDEDFGHSSFMARMAQAFDSGARTIALLSEAYQSSDYCLKECEVALTADPRNLNERLIVLRVADCAPTGMLKDLAYTDLVPILGQSDPALREDLLHRAIRVLIGAEPRQSGVDFITLYRHVPQIVHSSIAGVPGFTGRDAELAAISAALWNGGTAALTGSVAATALTGLGGIGKSVLAREYAWRERGRYHGVWWLRAEERTTLTDDLIELGARFIKGLDEVPDREKAACAALDFLARTPADKPWLLVCDNAENPAALEKLTPRTGAHVLITSRCQDWHDAARELPLEVFSEKAAVDYLIVRAHGVEQSPDETHAAATQIADDLGRLPLALAIARAHAWSMGWSLAQYREHLAEAKPLEREATKGVDYPRSLAASFVMAIEKAAAIAPEAGTPLRRRRTSCAGSNPAQHRP